GIVPSLAKAGASRIVLVATNVEELKHKGAFRATKEPIASVFQKATETFGPIDILIHNDEFMNTMGNINEEKPSLWWKQLTINTLGTYLVSNHFIKSLSSPETAGLIIYQAGRSELLSQKVISDVSAGYPNITTISLNPGLVDTNMLQMKNFDWDTPELVGGTVVRLTGNEAKFLDGRVISVNWDVEDLSAKKDEIIREYLLTIKLVGNFGLNQFHQGP
ncbi:hypothetical protein GCG54_00011201, partial [Colletotrichum gloeosporioides]